MELTTHQIYALFGIGLAVVILIGITYCTALKTGHASGWKEGREAGTNYWRPLFQAKREALTDAQDEICRRSRQSEEQQRTTECLIAQHSTELQRLQVLLACHCLSEEDTAILDAIASKLTLAAGTFAGIGSGDHARHARQLGEAAQRLAERGRSPVIPTQHPDSLLIEWLDENATFWAEDETIQLRFYAHADEHMGDGHIRDVLHLAVQQQAEQEQAAPIAPACPGKPSGWASVDIDHAKAGLGQPMCM